MQQRDSLTSDGLTGAVRHILFAAAVLSASTAGAADYRLEPRIEVGGMYNDNYRLTPTAENSVKGALVDAAVRWRAVTPTSDFNLMPEVRSTYFPDDRDEDDTNGYLTLGFTHQGQKWHFGLDGFYSHENLQTSEQPQASSPDEGGGLGGGVGVETGSVSTSNKRDLVRLAPAASFDLTQTSALEVALEYYMADYQHSNFASNTDFDSIAGDLGMSFRTSPTQRLLIAATGTRFNPDTPLSGTSTSYGVKGEWWTERTQIMQSYLRLGAERTKQDDPEVGEAPGASTNWILGAGIKAQYQITAIFADFTHGVRPNASGTLVTRDDLRVRVRREFTQKLGGYIGLLGARDKAANDDLNNFRDRRYYTGSVGVDYRFTPSWAITGSYDYRRQKRELEGTGTSNQVIVSVVWQPPRRP